MCSLANILTSKTKVKAEVIKLTELLLNALNRGDYETYTLLCDPHMTSFEPENLGNLINNMDYRRLALDQARQLQLSHIQQRGQPGLRAGQQVSTSAVAASAAAAAAAALSASSAQATKPASGQLQTQQVALAAAQAALASLNLGQPLPGASAPVASACSQRRQYSLMLNPSVYLLGEDGASIAYQKLSQTIDLQSGLLSGFEQSEETRIWHRRDGNRWLCVHFHRSLVTNNTIANQISPISPLLAGPQTSLSLIRSLTNQQQLDDFATTPQQAQQQSVPLISLNHSSTGSNSNPSQPINNNTSR